MRLYDYAASGNCFKVRLLLGLLGREYERVPVDIFAGDTLTDAFGELNPLRETPVLELDDGSFLTQSNAILWYLAEGTPFLPDTPWERGQVASWLSFEQERVMGGIGNPRFRLLTGRDATQVEARLATGRGALARLEDHLGGREWVVGGAPTIADLGLFAYVSVAKDAGLEHPPEVGAWLGRVRALPGFVDDFVSYPENARPGVARSIYDSMN
jgi:glutathione S-transferase